MLSSACINLGRAEILLAQLSGYWSLRRIWFIDNPVFLLDMEARRRDSHSTEDIPKTLHCNGSIGSFWLGHGNECGQPPLLNLCYLQKTPPNV